MKIFSLLAAVLVLSMSLATGDAAAKRLGGAKSTGMQRQMTAPTPPAAAPAPPLAPGSALAPSAAKAPTPAAPPPVAKPKSSWMGPLAGLAAGLGLAALASHFGFGEELASIMMIGLLVMGVLMVIGFLMRKRAAGLQPALAGAGRTPFEIHSPAGPQGLQGHGERACDTAGMGSASELSVPAEPAVAGRIPADFDVEGFVRNAKVNFIRLQAANDAGNLDDLRAFTTPEMFAELKMNIDDRQGATQATDVVKIDADVIEVIEEGNRYVVSVRFNGLIREERNGPVEPVDEIWHLVKPRNGQGGWTLAGIQQTH